jgi:adenine C2-methylase RlmN of 23S rRNA A2503 and tRNA A37
MARGEALVNPYLLSDSNSILSELQRLARERSLIPQFNISTIMPKTLAGKKLKDIFPGIQPEIYYSIYSVDEDFRKRWLPKSLPVEESLKMLVDWQEFSGKIPKIHFAFIENENDSIESVTAICDAVNNVGLKVNVNIVRYNPFSERQGTEPSEEIIERNMHVMQELLPNARINLIKKVGFDVQASCGMFAK